MKIVHLPATKLLDFRNGEMVRDSSIVTVDECWEIVCHLLNYLGSGEWTIANFSMAEI